MTLGTKHLGLFGFIRRYGLRATKRSLNELNKRVEREKRINNVRTQVAALLRSEAALNRLGRATFARRGDIDDEMVLL